MAQLLVDFGTIVGKIKPLHGGGQPNLSSTGFHDFHILAEAGIPYSRLHDVGGVFGGGKYVDIPNLFVISTRTKTTPRPMISPLQTA